MFLSIFQKQAFKEEFMWPSFPHWQCYWNLHSTKHRQCNPDHGLSGVWNFCVESAVHCGCKKCRLLLKHVYTRKLAICYLTHGLSEDDHLDWYMSRFSDNGCCGALNWNCILCVKIDYPWSMGIENLLAMVHK